MSAHNREIAVAGVRMRHMIQIQEYQQMNDEKIGAEDESRGLVRQNEAAKIQRKLVVQLQVGVAFLLLPEAEL